MKKEYIQYELFGMPGSGKTTIANYFEKEKNIQNIQEKYKDNLFGKILFHIFLNFFILNKKLRKKYHELLDIIGDDIYTNIIDNNINIKLYIKYIIFDYYLENYCKENIILEEGIIHYCIALYAEFDLDFNKLDMIVDKIYVDSNNIKCIGIKTSIEDVLRNIKKRNRKQCALDFLEGDDLKNLLKKYNEGVEYYSKKYELLTINEIKKQF